MNIVKINFDIGFGTRNPEALKAVQNGDYPHCLDQQSDLGRPRIYIEDDAVYLRACSGYDGPLWVSETEAKKLENWLDTYFTLIDTRAFSAHWREQRGAYSANAATFTVYTEDEIKKMIDRERLWSTFDEFLTNEKMQREGWAVELLRR